ncbi:MAG: methionine--tRNA ligase [Desulfobacula sp.]|jgi:methionyl-tRNA synthetase|nr:methionine--tRNA ligase [Desulfobacula sp.]
METKKQYFTTPIYYVNAKPHIGHAYTSIAADVSSRFKQMDAFETYFLTGTDEHGDKIVQAAEKQGTSPKEYSDKISALFQNLLPVLNVNNNQFIRTTDPDHIKVVQQILAKIHDSGDIYFDSYEGIYCYGCERFYQERELVDGKCPDHGVEPELIKESNYFFRMSEYQDWLIDHIKTNPDFIRPEQYKTELLSFLKEPLEDLCISRPKSRLTWGITLPFDEDYVTYVWFDALVNYVSAIGYPDSEKFKKFWPTTRHFVAKDIIKPHGIYWPIMLKAAGMDVYNGLNVHGFWNVGGSKMSKSIGNVTDPMEIIDQYGLDQFRYFLMREMVFGLDANFTEDILVSRINSDLANDLGNVFSRVTSMIHRYFDGKIPEIDTAHEKEKELSLENDAKETIDVFREAMGICKFHNGAAAVWNLISIMNKYIDKNEPWTLAKAESKSDILALILYNLMEGLRVVASLIYPIMPETSQKMCSLMNFDTDNGSDFFTLAQISPWGQIKQGLLIEKTEVLFPRIDIKKDDSSKKSNPPKPFNPALKNEITIDDFSKIDLRTGIVIKAEKIEKSKKLLKLRVDLGAQTRQIIAGIAKDYEPDDILNKQVIVVANLKEAKLMGEVSQGMILAASGKKNLVLSAFDKDITPGKQVK